MNEQMSVVLGTVAMEPKGEYSAEAYYEKLNTVLYNDSTYMAIKPSHNILPTDTEYWQLIGGGAKKEEIVQVFDTVADMKLADLKDGMTVQTLGYYEVNDGGGATYKITDTESQTDYQEELENGLYATLIIENDTVNVNQFGAKGDGITDDTNSIKTAFEFNKNDNLKIIFNKNKTYLVGGIIYLYSNKEIDLNNSILKAKSYLRFYNNVDSLSLTGYGAVKNISFKNGTIDGSVLGVLFGILHGENLIFENLKLLDCCVTGHIFDLGGCKNVKFENCNFTGSYISDSSTIYREMIQPDYANYTALPYWGSTEYAGYDNLPTINLVVNRCNFEKGNGIHLPNAIGSHALYGDLAVKNIIITNNTFHDSTSYTIRFPRVQNLIVDNNIFYNDEEREYTGVARYINLETFINSDAVNPEISKDIRISNNTFYKEVETKLTDIISVKGNSDYITENVLIENNVYYGNWDNSDSAGVADFLQYSNVRNLTISNNIINKAKNVFLRTADENVVYRVNILNNIIKNSRTLFRFQVTTYTDINEYNLKNNIIETSEGFVNDTGDISIFGVGADYTATSNENRITINTAIKTNGLIANNAASNAIALKTHIMKFKVYGNITIQNNNSSDENYDLVIKNYIDTDYEKNKINAVIEAGKTKTIIIPTTFIEVPSISSFRNVQYIWITPGLKANDKIIASKTKIFVETC